MYFSSGSMKGKFLIATPSLRDPNFSEGVVFLCDHNEKGAFGLIINKKSDLKAETHFKKHGELESIKNVDLYIGGPVHTNHIMILCRSHEIIPSETRIIDDVVLLNSIPERVADELFDETNSSNIRLYLGCSGWEENQLESEIAAGAWKILSYKPEMIFSDKPKHVWRDNLARLGGQYGILSEMPDQDDLYKN